MLTLADELPPGQKFDAVVIDEAQDFPDSWWPVVLAALKDPDTGGIYAFTDEGQRVFARYGEPQSSSSPWYSSETCATPVRSPSHSDRSPRCG